MITGIASLPPTVCGLRLTGTVLGEDLSTALSAETGAAALLLDISGDFDGYWAEVVRALGDWQADQGDEGFTRLAVICRPDMADLADKDLKDSVAGESRTFTASQMAAAAAWAAAGKSG